MVIVFDDPKGEAGKQDEMGGVLYEIPPDGVLRLRDPAPEVGFYHMNYFYVRPDGSRKKLPERVDSAVLQVFAVIDGATGGEREERPPARWTWRSYVVGIPSERDDWVQKRNEAESRAIGIPSHL